MFMYPLAFLDRSPLLLRRTNHTLLIFTTIFLYILAYLPSHARTALDVLRLDYVGITTATQPQDQVTN